MSKKLFVKCKPEYFMDVRVCLCGILVNKQNYIEIPPTKLEEAKADRWLIISFDGINPVTDTPVEAEQLSVTPKLKLTK